MGKRQEPTQVELHRPFRSDLRHHRLRYVFCCCNHTAALADPAPQPDPQTVTQVMTSAPLATSASPMPLSERRRNSGVIAGAVVGGVLGLAIIVGACWVLIHRRPKSPLPSSKLDPRFPSKLGSEDLSEAPTYSGNINSNELPGPDISRPELSGLDRPRPELVA